MNPLVRGIYRPSLFRAAGSALRTCRTPMTMLNVSRRSVSRQVWDQFGFLKDGTDLAKRDSTAWARIPGYRYIWLVLLMGPAHFMMWMHGVFDYIFRRRTIAPLPVDYEAERPWSPPDGYENPLFTPARKWAKIREEKRRRKAQQQG
mmetsp:Transcript_34154/g.55677  ORF Transcript_34154/g.55677 Transcript_34154/m.55677 type:complete len:147 (+) Transcript_34154:87-527(+)